MNELQAKNYRTKLGGANTFDWVSRQHFKWE